MVLYFLSVTGSKEEYLGTAAAFFLINGIYNSIFRVFSGILTSGQIPYILTGIAAILAGVTLSHKAVDRLDEGMLRNITYLTIGLTGIVKPLGVETPSILLPSSARAVGL